jgi:uncharacterized repeat protein (TIGR01451 family)
MTRIRLLSSMSTLACAMAYIGHVGAQSLVGSFNPSSYPQGAGPNTPANLTVSLANGPVTPTPANGSYVLFSIYYNSNQLSINNITLNPAIPAPVSGQTPGIIPASIPGCSPAVRATLNQASQLAWTANGSAWPSAASNTQLATILTSSTVESVQQRDVCYDLKVFPAAQCTTVPMLMCSGASSGSIGGQAGIAGSAAPPPPPMPTIVARDINITTSVPRGTCTAENAGPIRITFGRNDNVGYFASGQGTVSIPFTVTPTPSTRFTTTCVSPIVLSNASSVSCDIIPTNNTLIDGDIDARLSITSNPQILGITPPPLAQNSVFVNGTDEGSAFASTRTITRKICSEDVAPINPDLTISKTTSTPNVKSGEPIVYALGVSALAAGGPVAAGPVVVTDTLPTNITIADASAVSGTNWDCTASAAPSTISCTYTGSFPVAAGASVGGAITINALAGNVDGTVVRENTATVTAPNDAVPGNNQSSTTVSISGVSDTTSTISCTPTTPSAGATVTCTLTCTNNGPGAAINGSCGFSGALPAGVSSNTCAVPATAASQVIGTAGALSCVVAFPAPASGTYQVTGGSSADNDSNGGVNRTAGNNPSSSGGEVAPPPLSDTTSTISCTPTTPSAGATVTCTLTCTNNGPGAAINGSCGFSGALPAGVTSNTCAVPATAASQVVGAAGALSCVVAFPAPASGTYQVTGGSSADNDSNGGVTRTAGNNPSSASGVLIPPPQPDTTSTISCTPTTPGAGATVTCTLICTNNGPGPALNGSCGFTGVLPAGVTSNTCAVPATVALQSEGAAGALSCVVAFTAPTSGTYQVTGGSSADNDGNGGSVRAAGNNPSAANGTVAVLGVAQPVPAIGAWALALLAFMLIYFGRRRINR